jgi:hypothetical protein
MKIMKEERYTEGIQRTRIGVIMEDGSLEAGEWENRLRWNLETLSSWRNNTKKKKNRKKKNAVRIYVLRFILKSS